LKAPNIHASVHSFHVGQVENRICAGVAPHFVQ
jgi:hypothetical protein